MARKYQFGPNRFAWNLERCEETLIIAAYNEVARFIPPDLQWVKYEFEHIFYEAGNGVSVHLIDAINDVRKRKKLDPVVLRETQVGPIARSADYSARAEQRRRLRDELAVLSQEKLAAVVEQAREQAASLPPPHFTFRDYRDRQTRIQEVGRLSGQEVVRRVAAVASASAAAHEGRNGRVLKMLTLASDPALQEEIISTLEPVTALDLAERIEDPTLRNALVRRSLSLVAARPTS